MIAAYDPNVPVRISGSDINALNYPHRRQELMLARKVLHKNSLIASHLRKHFEDQQIFVVNLISSPGAGKTTLIEKTLYHFQDQHIYVVTADQDSRKDEYRIKQTNRPVVQVNTGACCHLDADMLYHALHQIRPCQESILIVENVGNLLFPASYDLGEARRIILWSVTDGAHAPLKYPAAFASADLCLINKLDLLPYVDFNMERAKGYFHQVNPTAQIIELSATQVDTMQDWFGWLYNHIPIQIA